MKHYSETLTPHRLQETRKMGRLSRVELARRMGVSYLTVRLWEQPGAQIPRLAELALITVMMLRKEELENDRDK